MQIDIINETSFHLSSDIEHKIQEAIHAVLALEKRDTDGEVSVLFVDNDAIQALNRTFRNKDSVTDVLSFPQYEMQPNDKLPEVYITLGDIVISLETAMQQAESFGHSLEREIIYLTVHSTLHLLGYDHMEPEAQMLMRQKEKAVLKALKIFKG